MSPDSNPVFHHAYGPSSKKIKDMCFLPETQKIAVVSDNVAGCFGNIFNYKKDVITEANFVGQTNEPLTVSLPNNKY